MIMSIITMITIMIHYRDSYSNKWIVHLPPLSSAQHTAHPPPYTPTHPPLLLSPTFVSEHSRMRGGSGDPCGCPASAASALRQLTSANASKSDMGATSPNTSGLMRRGGSRMLGKLYLR